MADPHSPSDALEWMNRVWGFITGVVMAVVGMTAWIVPKFKSVNETIEEIEQTSHRENDQLAGELHQRINGMEKLLVMLETQHKAHIQLYRGLQDSLKSLSEKTDEQTKVLNQMVGELKAMHQRSDG